MDASRTSSSPRAASRALTPEQAEALSLEIQSRWERAAEARSSDNGSMAPVTARARDAGETDSPPAPLGKQTLMGLAAVTGEAPTNASARKATLVGLAAVRPEEPAAPAGGDATAPARKATLVGLAAGRGEDEAAPAPAVAEPKSKGPALKVIEGGARKSSPGSAPASKRSPDRNERATGRAKPTPERERPRTSAPTVAATRAQSRDAVRAVDHASRQKSGSGRLWAYVGVAGVLVAGVALYAGLGRSAHDEKDASTAAGAGSDAKGAAAAGPREGRIPATAAPAVTRASGSEDALAGKPSTLEPTEPPAAVPDASPEPTRAEPPVTEAQTAPSQATPPAAPPAKRTPAPARRAAPSAADKPAAPFGAVQPSPAAPPTRKAPSSAAFPPPAPKARPAAPAAPSPAPSKPESNEGRINRAVPF